MYGQVAMRSWLFTLNVCLLAVATLAAVVAGCAMQHDTASRLPSGHSFERGQLVVYSDFELPPQHRLIEEVVAQRRDIADALALPLAAEPVNVYLFDTRQAYSSYMLLHYPDLPPRRAFFVEDDTTLSVFAFWGDRVAEDLRHEVTHGYLHATAPNLPLWLDEGLAEFYETGRGAAGLNQEHLTMLLERHKTGAWHPNLPRLETVTDPLRLTRLDYAEAWLWTHFLMDARTGRRDLLRTQLKRLRVDGYFSPLSKALFDFEDEPERAVVQHLYQLVGQQLSG